MTDLRKAAEQALEDICGAKLCEVNSMSSRAEMLRLMDKAAEALRQALAQPVDAVNMSQKRVDEMAKGEHEPFAWMVDNEGNKYKIPEANKGPLLKAMERKWVKKSRRRKWVELTDEDIQSCPSWCGDQHDFSYEIEAKLKEKNASA